MAYRKDYFHLYVPLSSKSKFWSPDLDVYSRDSTVYLNWKWCMKSLHWAENCAQILTSVFWRRIFPPNVSRYITQNKFPVTYFYLPISFRSADFKPSPYKQPVLKSNIGVRHRNRGQSDWLCLNECCAKASAIGRARRLAGWGEIVPFHHLPVDIRLNRKG